MPRFASSQSLPCLEVSHESCFTRPWFSSRRNIKHKGSKRYITNPTRHIKHVNTLLIQQDRLNMCIPFFKISFESLHSDPKLLSGRINVSFSQSKTRWSITQLTNTHMCFLTLSVSTLAFFVFFILHRISNAVYDLSGHIIDMCTTFGCGYGVDKTNLKTHIWDESWENGDMRWLIVLMKMVISSQM